MRDATNEKTSKEKELGRVVSVVEEWHKALPNYPDVVLTIDVFVKLITLVMDNYESEPVKQRVKGHCF